MIKLAAEGVLDNTYIIYTSDNGYHMGSHRMQPGKRYHYEEDTLVPFFIRGPGIPAGSSSRQLATMVDIAPTMVQLAGGALRPDFDGIALDVKNPSVYSDREL